MLAYPSRVFLEEQGPRDGIQAEKVLLPTERKLAMIQRLVAAGHTRVQVASFVHPKLVPQMADAEAVCAGLTAEPGVVYTGLVLNPKGLDRAAGSGLTHVAVSMSASAAHSQKNANRTLEQARADLGEMIRLGKEKGLVLRGGVQCAFGCRLQGRVSPDLVLELVREQLDRGVDEVSLADSTGMGHPAAVADLAGRVVELAGGKPVWLHLHDTEGKGLANALAALQVGVRHFDTALGGLGGCPFIRGASGNVATEDLVTMLHQMGIATGVDTAKVAGLSREMEEVLGHPAGGKMHRLLGRDDLVMCG